MSSGIFNAEIVKWQIRRSEKYNETLELSMEIKSTEGNVIYAIPIKDINKFFDIIKINDIKELQGSACIVLINNDHFCTVGNFLAAYKSDIQYSWMYSEKYKDLILKYYKETGRHPDI